MDFMLQPSRTNSVASQSSNSGCVGGVPERPKFETLATMPRPKWRDHDLIHGNTGGQWVIGLGEPVRQSQPAPAGAGERRNGRIGSSAPRSATRWARPASTGSPNPTGSPRSKQIVDRRLLVIGEYPDVRLRLQFAAQGL